MSWGIATALLASILVWHWFGREIYTCPSCGTRTGKHAKDCQWGDE